jgi:hypothetical protein
MNNRIKELSEQAYERKQSMVIDPNTYEMVPGNTYERVLNQEKFAELILQDIDRIVDELYHAMPLEQASVLLTLDENIKEHFYGDQ